MWTMATILTEINVNKEKIGMNEQRWSFHPLTTEVEHPRQKSWPKFVIESLKLSTHEVMEEGRRTNTLCHRPQIPLISVLELSQRREIYREITPVNLVSSSKTPFGAKIRANALQGWGWFGHKKVQGAKPSSRRLQVFFSGRLALTRRTDGQTSKHLIGKRIRRGNE